MSLQRNENSTLNALQQEMEHLAVMNAAREQEARKDKEVTLLLSSVQKMGMMQQSFMQNMLEEFDELNKNQMKLLNVQEQYAQSVRASTAELFKKFAQEYIKAQNELFYKIQEGWKADTQRLLDDYYNVAGSVRAAANHAEDIAGKVFSLSRWREVLFYLCPIAIFIDVLIRIFQIGMGFS